MKRSTVNRSYMVCILPQIGYDTHNASHYAAEPSAPHAAGLCQMCVGQPEAYVLFASIYLGGSSGGGS